MGGFIILMVFPPSLFLVILRKSPWWPGWFWDDCQEWYKRACDYGFHTGQSRDLISDSSHLHLHFQIFFISKDQTTLSWWTGWGCTWWCRPPWRWWWWRWWVKDIAVTRLRISPTISPLSHAASSQQIPEPAWPACSAEKLFKYKYFVWSEISDGRTR